MSYGIVTSFVRKGWAAKDELQMKLFCSEVSKQRATRMEGRFSIRNNITHSPK